MLPDQQSEEDSSYLTPFSKATLTGLFVGIIATLVCLVYNILYREQTGFSLSEIINVSSVIFMVNLLFVVLGVIYYWFIRAFRKGAIWYAVALLLLTAFVFMKSLAVQRTADPLLNAEFQHLLAAIVLIAGVAGALGIPFLFYNKKFEQHVL